MTPDLELSASREFTYCGDPKILATGRYCENKELNRKALELELFNIIPFAASASRFEKKEEISQQVLTLLNTRKQVHDDGPQEGLDKII